MEKIQSHIFKYFSSLIELETGIQYDESNHYLLANRLQNIVKFLNFNDLDSLWTDIQKNGLNAPAKSLILDMATNNETSFFRDNHVFEFFKTHFIPKTMEKANNVRIWCAATSTGQEPYSLAMIMSELKASGINKVYNILATDFSERVLNQAASGIYSQLEVQRGLPASYLVKYFEQITKENSTLPCYKIKPELSSHITFRQLNLLHSWPSLGMFDIIFCRNVLIYLSVENKKQVIAKFANLLAPGGYLVLGSAESLVQLSNDFDMENYGNAIVYRLKQSIKPYS